MRIPVPLHYRSRDEAYKSTHDRAAIHQAFEESRYVDIPIAALTSTQRTVHSPPEPKSESEPTVIMNGGRHYIHNGHHRTTLAAQRGQSTIRARVARLDAGPPRLFRQKGHAGELLLIEPSAMAVEYHERDIEDCATMVGDVAVLEIEGPLESKPSRSWWSYFDDYESILCRFLAAIESNEVRGILLKIDSPGGAAAGLNECVDAMRRAKEKCGKPVHVYADEGAYSAAYALACVADRIVLPRAGGLGSIGVITTLVDWTEANKKDGIRVEVVTSGKRKSYGNPNVPLSDDAIAAVQDRIDGLAKIYFKLVMKARGIDARSLEAGTFYGKRAVKVGIADGIESLEDCLIGLQSALDKPSRSKSLSPLTENVSPKDRTMTLAQLTAAVKAATASLAKAKKGIDQDRAAATLALAESALAKEMAKKHTVVDKHTSEMEESSSSSSSSSESSESESESESAAESEEAESEEAESEEAEKAVLAVARQVTGKTKSREIIGTLTAMAEGHSRGDKDHARLARLEASHKSAKVEALIASAKSGPRPKVTPGNEAKVRAIAKAHGYRALKAHLDASHPAIDMTEYEAAEDAGEGAVITPEQRKMWTKMGYSEEKMLKLAKATAKEMARLASGKPPKRGEL